MSEETHDTEPLSQNGQQEALPKDSEQDKPLECQENDMGQASEDQWKVGDLVWAKLKGHPWYHSA